MAPHQAISAHCPSSTSNMSDKCGNCDCADRSQCTRFERREEEVVADAGEHDGCKCGANCACGSNCSCGK
uniref:Metallothionein-like protein n=1 Tax=Setaria italica TaxID=4555 RepID=K3XP10_SETIT